MAISRSLMNRQLQANGGIMQVAPREKFGLGSSIKKFVRKIIPNEVAEVAVKAAPFVAPFNPLLAAGMSGLGTFDQTGSIGDSLKSGGMNYALGQGARYLGGGAQNLQTGFNPFSGYDASAGLTRGLLTNPVSNQGGLGKFFSNRGTQGIQPISGGEYGQFTEPVFGAGDAIGGEGLTGAGEIITDATTQTITGSPNQMTITDSIKQIVSPNSTIGDRGNAALDLLKRGSKAAFTKTDAKGNIVIDKAAVLGAATFAASYAEARALAADAGIDLTEEEYDEATKADKQEEYASYLTNFFGGKKDGGRIGFESGANEMIKTQLLEEIMPDTSTEDFIIIMTEEGPIRVKKSDYEAMPGMFRDTTTSLYGDAGRGRPVPEFADGGRIGFKSGTIILGEDELAEMGGEQGLKLKLLAEKFMEEGMSESDAYEKAADSLYAKGGRVSRKFGSPKEGESEVGIMTIDVEAGDDDDMEDMKMAGITFSSAEKSYLFRRLGGAGGSDRSFTMPQLYRVLNNPDRYAEDAAVLKEIAIMGLGKKDGGRIEFRDGSSTGSFGTDRYLSEMLESGSGLFNRGEDFFNKYEDMVKEGKLDSRMFDMLKEYKTLEKEAETTDDKFQNIDLIDKAEETLDKDALKYYDKKFKDLEKQEDDLTKQEEGIIALEKKTNFDASEITKTPDFQNWLSLYETDKMKAFDHPYADIYLGVLGVKLKGRDKSYDEIVGLANGGRIKYAKGANRVSELLVLRDEKIGKGEDVSDIEAEIFQLTGKTFRSVGGISDVPTGNMRKNNAGVVERDYRDEGGFVPVGIKERADDVPAMLSKNEFVMTADAVRGIGNGSVEEGSKKLYNTMKKAEQVGKA